MTSTARAEARDKLGVFILCGLALVIIGGISWGAIQQRIPSDSQTLLGVIVGGIMIFARECLVVIRQFWSDAKNAKTFETLANAGPPLVPTDVPANVAEAADQVAEAATNEADKIASKTEGTKP